MEVVNMGVPSIKLFLISNIEQLCDERLNQWSIFFLSFIKCSIRFLFQGLFEIEMFPNCAMTSKWKTTHGRGLVILVDTYEMKNT